MAANEVFGPFQWANAALYKTCIAYHAILADCVSIEEPSPFKRAAAMAVSFMQNCPIYGSLNGHMIIDQVRHIGNASGAILIFEYIRSSLHGAVIERADGQAVLEHRIRVSEHTMKDIIHALSHAGENGNSCFHSLALLFEQLAYIDNPEACYSRTY